MKSRLLAGILLVPTLSIPLAGCATDGRPMTTNQKIAGCTAMVAGGALLGALIGGQGRGNAGNGALIGAGVGGAACGVWLAFENEKDKRRIAEAQMAALRSGQSINQSWVGDDGRARTVSVVPSTETLAPLKTGGPDRICRSVATQPTLEGKSASAVNSVFCRDANGDWAPARA